MAGEAPSALDSVRLPIGEGEIREIGGHHTYFVPWRQRPFMMASCLGLHEWLYRVIRITLPSGGTVGSRRFCDEDYVAYLDLMAEWCGQCGVEVWAYCLMPHHVHLIAVPASEDGLRRAIGEAHRRYTRRVNFREKWRGHLGA